MKFFKRSKRKDWNGEYKERIITSLNDIISGLRISLLWDKECGLELGNIYSGGEDGGKNRSNPMHGVDAPSPSTAPVKDRQVYHIHH